MRFLILGLFFIISNLLNGQTAPNRYWIHFADKDNTPFSIYTPSDFLSEKTIDRRAKFDIPIKLNDIPVNQNYIDQVVNLGDILIINKSKWFNAITISLEDASLLQEIAALPFVSQIKSVQHLVSPKKIINYSNFNKAIFNTPEEYGYSYPQIAIHNGQKLHEMGFQGQGMDIAIFDAGFNDVDNLPAFERLRDEGRIIETRDFTDNEENVYTFSNHGKNVLSIMAAYEKDSLIGSAFLANYYLFVTEETSFEYIIEEDNWVAAAEYADSIGIDIINTSLGYSTFDDSTQNHTYQDMDGNTTRITIAMDIAASKGIIPVTSAGNSGNSEWHYITAPADADSCLTVGAIDTAGVAAYFTSFGPTADGRIKPDVVSVGFNTAYALNDSTYGHGHGTSYSSPNLAGLTACLWQAFPEKNNVEIMNAVKESSHLYNNPNDSIGYGIPDFWKAFQYLTSTYEANYNLGINVYPSPFSEYFTLTLKPKTFVDEVKVSLINNNGQFVVKENTYPITNNIVFVQRFDDEVRNIGNGIYFLKIDCDGQSEIVKLEKIDFSKK